MPIIDCLPAATKDDAKKLIGILVERYNLSDPANSGLSAEREKLQAYYDEDLKAVYLEYIGPDISKEELQRLLIQNL
ncbi:MAG TPA: hypothetical protein VE035_19685 [Puia sp.]|nr:hypothetical protein [Puia sp.]